MVDWLHTKKYRNVIIEVDNECNLDAYDHPILTGDRVNELILLVKWRSHDGYSFLTGTSYGGNSIPTSKVVKDILAKYRNVPFCRIF